LTIPRKITAAMDHATVNETKARNWFNGE
jgi:hypothetical protein